MMLILITSLLVLYGVMINLIIPFLGLIVMMLLDITLSEIVLCTCYQLRHDFVFPFVYFFLGDVYEDYTHYSFRLV